MNTLRGKYPRGGYPSASPLRRLQHMVDVPHRPGLRHHLPRISNHNRVLRNIEVHIRSRANQHIVANRYPAHNHRIRPHPNPVAQRRSSPPRPRLAAPIVTPCAMLMFDPSTAKGLITTPPKCPGKTPAQSPSSAKSQIHTESDSDSTTAGYRDTAASRTSAFALRSTPPCADRTCTETPASADTPPATPAHRRAAIPIQVRANRLPQLHRDVRNPSPASESS